ncbi:MAG: DoxX family protein [Myxococcota bacterium]
MRESNAVLFWISTVLLCLFLALSSASYVFHSATLQGIRELGIPDYLRIQLAVLKVLAAAILIVPSVPWPLREWAYAGVAFFLLTAIVGHAAHRDPFVFHVINGVLLIRVYVSRAAAPR